MAGIIRNNDDNILNEIKSLSGILGNDFWPELPTQVQNAIDQAKNQLDRGEGTPHAEVMGKIKSHFLNK